MRELYLRIFFFFRRNQDDRLGCGIKRIWNKFVLLDLFPNFCNLLHSIKLLDKILFQFNIFENHGIIKPFIFSKEIINLINNPLNQFDLIFQKFIIISFIGLILTVNNLINLILIKQMFRKILKYFLTIAECPVIHPSQIH